MPGGISRAESWTEPSIDVALSSALIRSWYMAFGVVELWVNLRSCVPR